MGGATGSGPTAGTATAASAEIDNVPRLSATSRQQIRDLMTSEDACTLSRIWDEKWNTNDLARAQVLVLDEVGKVIKRLCKATTEAAGSVSLSRCETKSIAYLLSGTRTKAESTRLHLLKALKTTEISAVRIRQPRRYRVLLGERLQPFPRCLRRPSIHPPRLLTYLCFGSQLDQAQRSEARAAQTTTKRRWVGVDRCAVFSDCGRALGLARAHHCFRGGRIGVLWLMQSRSLKGLTTVQHTSAYQSRAETACCEGHHATLLHTRVLYIKLTFSPVSAHWVYPAGLMPCPSP